MSNRTLALVFGIPVAIILLAVAATITFPPNIRTSSMMGSSVAPGFAPSPMPPTDAYYGGVTGEEKVAYDRGMMIYPVPPQTGGQTAAEVDQKIIKTGSLSMVVDDVSEAASEIGVLATGKGGFVQDSSVSEREDGTHFGSITVRVPAKDFETMTTEVKKLATLVKNETASGQDVTEQFTDLQARLRNAEREEAAFLAILAQARSVEDILAVHRELFNVRAQIESLQGQIKYLENATSYSTLSIALSEEPALNIPTKEFRPFSSAKEAAQALFAVFQNLAVVLIWVVIVGGGLLLPVLALAWVISRFLKRRQKSKR